ncbi:MAG: LamB/YcsF family protein [Phreatobacter sp.]|uniref:LamB/YcsF family protein n=1 Tax=Phreatobacter sp. TaxID=1966341 RepID=UPI0040365AD7
MTAVDLNSDMGEGFGPWKMGDDEAMLSIVSSANVACGWHAGDPLIMHRTAEIAKAKGVSIGAHPGFGDLWGFGRRVIRGDSMADLEKQIAYQVGAMQALAVMAGHKVTHVKTHGALGNMTNDDDDMAMAVGRAIKAVDRDLVYVVMPGLSTERAAEKLGLPMAREVFADRTYDDSGNLTSRKVEGAVIHDAALAATRVLRMVEDQEVVTVTGKRLKVGIDTICVHGDNPAAVAMARTVRETLEGAGIAIRPFRVA